MLNDRLGLGGPCAVSACGTRRTVENYTNLRPLADQFYTDEPETPYNDYTVTGNDGVIDYFRTEANRIVNARRR